MQFSTFLKEVTLEKDLAKFAENPKNLEFLEMSPWLLMAVRIDLLGWKTEYTKNLVEKLHFFPAKDGT